MPDLPPHTDLEDELRRVLARTDPVPPGLVEAGIGAFAWRTIDADLAELVFDSLTDQDEAALVRGGQQGRLLSFRAGTLTIEVEVTGTGPSRRLMGQLMPPQRGGVDVRHGDSTTTVEADELGRFSAGPLPAGPVSLRCRPGSAPGQPAIVTEWVSI
ncbi:MAG TPA: hypothetical protein VEC76_09065 [Streptosporangiaceae bacterium]|nr:hypothetical protein [Streptosporangiaceae bacterium]